MKFYKRLITAAMALGLTVIIVLNTTVMSYAGLAGSDGQYGMAYGNDHGAETFYLWHKVTGDDKKPLYSYLSDGDDKDLYEKDKKTFRVMIVQNFEPGTNHLWWFLGMTGAIIDIVLNLQDPFNVYYSADWTRIYYGAQDNLGESAIPVAYNPEIDLSSETFITRGAARTFICDYARVWKNDDGCGEHTMPLKTEYEGTHRYHFYFPDADDVTPKYTLAFTAGRTFHDFGAFDKDGKIWGGSESMWADTEENNDKEYFKSHGLFVDTWAVVQKNKRSDQMTLVPYDYNGNDYTLGMKKNECALYLNEFKGDQYENWTIYVGEECPSEILEPMKSKSTEKLSSGSYRSITKATYLKKDDEFVIDENAVLFVDSLLILRGKITNHGIIVVEEGGAIVSWNSNNGTIVNDGGDIIVRKKAKVYVSNLQSKNSQGQLYDPLYVTKANYESGVIDKRSSGIEYAETVENYKFAKIEKQKVDGRFDVYTLKFDTSQFKLHNVKKENSSSIKVNKSVIQSEFGEPKN